MKNIVWSSHERCTYYTFLREFEKNLRPKKSSVTIPSWDMSFQTLNADSRLSLVYLDSIKYLYYAYSLEIYPQKVWLWRRTRCVGAQKMALTASKSRWNPSHCQRPLHHRICGLKFLPAVKIGYRIPICSKSTPALWNPIWIPVPWIANEYKIQTGLITNIYIELKSHGRGKSYKLRFWLFFGHEHTLECSQALLASKLILEAAGNCVAVVDGHTSVREGFVVWLLNWSIVCQDQRNATAAQ